MNYEKIKADIQALSAKKFEIIGHAKAEERETNIAEDVLLAEFEGAIAGLKAELEKPQGALTMPGPTQQALTGGSIRRDGAYALIEPNGKKDYRSMFGSGGYEWPDKDSNFFSAVFSGRHHPGLIKNAMSENIPSSGGFLVPTEQAARIHAVSLENEIVQPKAYVQPMASNEIKIPAMSIGDHSTALFGGFTASYVSEAGTISEADPKARAMTLNAKKLTGLIRFSSELNADTPGGMTQIETLCGKGLGWYRDKAFLKGTGAGEPLGILDAGCTVEVDKESGQAADTIVYENLTKMMSRMFAGSFANSVWVCHQTCIPQLLTLSLAVGTGGAAIPVMYVSRS